MGGPEHSYLQLGWGLSLVGRGDLMESARARLERKLKGYMRNGTGKSVDCCSLDGKPREVAISTDILAQTNSYLDQRSV
jgi:hypothetical protein